MAGTANTGEENAAWRQAHSHAFAGIVAGARIFGNRPIPELPQTGFFDLDIQVDFFPGNAPEALPSENCRDGEAGVFPLPLATGLPGYLARSGRWVRIWELPPVPWNRRVSVCRVLPHAASLQGKITLHASAVACPSGVFAFLGFCGAGKSTLARGLAELGWQPAADDLLPLRTQEGLPVIPGEKGGLPLRALCLLSRRAGLDHVRALALSPADCLKALLSQGYGDVACKKVWATQFAAYERIAGSIPGFSLVVPDRLERLAQSVSEVAEILATQPRLDRRP